MTASFCFDPVHGGRVSSLRIGEFELLFGDSDMKPMSWGAYPMVPYAGRVDRGRFHFDSKPLSLEINHGEHAIHGTAFTAEWQELGPGHLVHELDDRWPLGGTVSHRGQLSGDEEAGSLLLELSVMATGRPMPAMIGWHPWFNRRLSPDGPNVQVVFEGFDSAEMYEIGDDMIPTGRVVSPPDPGPWDHPFRSLGQPVRLVWVDQLQIDLTSSCDHWVIYDQRDHAFCVEPQSGPPNIFNPQRFDIEPTILHPGEQLVHTFTLDWTSR
ncbi:MAG: aldose 1-epimerase [Acidimicrobiales bacterium]